MASITSSPKYCIEFQSSPTLISIATSIIKLFWKFKHSRLNLSWTSIFSLLKEIKYHPSRLTGFIFWRYIYSITKTLVQLERKFAFSELERLIPLKNRSSRKAEILHEAVFMYYRQMLRVWKKKIKMPPVRIVSSLVRFMWNDSRTRAFNAREPKETPTAVQNMHLHGRKPVRFNYETV